jgi:Tol biopolymer transport system component
LQDASGAGFSPDGKWVAYTKLSDSGSALWLSPVRNHDEHLEISTVGFTPRWSHNGDWVAYSTADPNDGHGDIWICRISESNGLPVVSDKKQLTNRDESIYGLTWDGSNSAVIFASRLAGSQQLYRVKVADGSLIPVISGVGEYGAPSICGDGSSLVFHHYRLVNDLMLAQLGESGVAQNISYSDDHRYPRIAPSNDKLISILRGADDADHLYLTDLKTKHSVQLTHRLARHPSWLDQQNAVFLSPDGTHNNTEVIVVNTITQETRTLTSFEGTADWLAVHPDGKRLIVVLRSEGKERIVLRNLTSSIDQIVQEGSEYEYLRWSPDGSSICWDRPGVSRNAPHMSGGIWLLNIGETEPRQIARDGYCPVWSTDGGAIFYVLRQTPKGLRRYDIATQQDRKICDWDTVFSFDIRGDRIVFAQHRNDSQIYSVSLRL